MFTFETDLENSVLLVIYSINKELFTLLINDDNGTVSTLIS